MSTTELAVWLYGTHVATLTPVASRPGRVRWTWRAAAHRRWAVRSRVLSHLLPADLPENRPLDVAASVFCTGLLPEGSARTHHAVAAGVDPEDTFGLLAAYGRDTAGALVFLDPAESPADPEPATYTPITEVEVGQRLREVASTLGPAGVQSTSLAGMTPKVGLRRSSDGSWLQPVGGSASTWILKVGHEMGAPAEDALPVGVVHPWPAW